MSLLSSGIYTITNKYTNQPVGRARAEDRSLLPKRIVNHPEGFQGETTKWRIIALPNSQYRLESLGAPTFEQNRLVYAALMNEKPEGWIITARPQAGDRTFTIETASRNAGWVLPTEDLETQVNCRPLIIGPSDPPFFPPTELWVIVPLPA